MWMLPGKALNALNRVMVTVRMLDNLISELVGKFLVHFQHCTVYTAVGVWLANVRNISNIFRSMPASHVFQMCIEAHTDSKSLSR